MGACLTWGAGVLALDALRQASWQGGGALIDGGTEGALLLSAIAAAGAAGAVWTEVRVERAPRLAAGLEVALAALVALWVSVLGVVIAGALAPSASVLALRVHVGPFLAAGLGASFGTLAPRFARRLVEWAQVRWDTRFFPSPPAPDAGIVSSLALHTMAGVAAGAVGALAWYQVGIALGDRFLAMGIAGWLVVVVSALLTTGVPLRAFQGWLRVRVGTRAGWRVPLDAMSVVRSERFVGSFPVGMDVHLPASEGVAPVHASVRAAPDGTFAVRGLSREPVRLQRFLEWVDLAVDPTLPAPLETPLVDGDRVRLGDRVEIELVVVPREDGP